MTSRRGFLGMVAGGVSASMLRTDAFAAASALQQEAFATDALTAFIGDSIEQGTPASGDAFSFGGDAYPTILGLLSGGRIRPHVNAGIGGESLALIRDRFVAGVIEGHSIKAARCVIGGGANDLAGLQAAMNTSEADGDAYADEVLGHLAFMYETAIDAGMPPAGRGLTPREEFTAQIEFLEPRIRRMCERRDMPFVDIRPALDNGSGGYRDGFTDDGVHPIRGGLRAIAEAFVETLGPTYPEAAELLATTADDQRNLIANGLMLDQDNDGVADGWSPGGEDGEAVYRVETDDRIVGNWQIVETAAEGAGSRTLAQLVGKPGDGKWEAGDVLQFAGLVSTKVEEGRSAPTIRLSFANATPFPLQIPFYRLGTDVELGVFSRLFVAPEGGENLVAMLINSENSPRGTGTIKTAQWMLRNLTREGMI